MLLLFILSDPVESRFFVFPTDSQPDDVYTQPESLKEWTGANKQRSGMRTLYRLNKTPESLIAGAMGGGSDAEVLAFGDHMFRVG